MGIDRRALLNSCGHELLIGNWPFRADLRNLAVDFPLNIETEMSSFWRNFHHCYTRNYHLHNSRCSQWRIFTMTSSNWNISRAAGVGIHRSPVYSPHKGQGRGDLIFSLIPAWTNSWANNGDTGDLRRYRAHYDVIVMFFSVAAFLFSWSMRWMSNIKTIAPTSLTCGQMFS